MEDTYQFFGVIDIIVFAGSLLVCGMVGLYFAVKDRNNVNVEDYYFGGKRMSPVAVGISLSLTYISALSVIGFPTESYLYGTVLLWYPLASLPAVTFSILYYVPMYHRLQLKTIYEFLEMRFHSALRKMVSACQLVSLLIYMSFTVYAPALALSAVTPISLQWSIVGTSGICTFYTTLGGVKAVVWTDVIQFAMMFIGSVAALIKATVDVGGINLVGEALERSGRLNFFEADPNPTIRSTVWTVFIGATISQTVNSCVNQSVCQRFLSCKNVAGAKRAALTTIFPKVTLTLISLLSGCVAYAYFEGCDPLASGVISKKDQMFPYLVLKVFRNVPGMAGVFVAATFSGTLSTVSSGLNSASALLLQDFLIPLRPTTGIKAQKAFGKLVALLLGAVVTALAYLCLILDGTVISMVLSLKGAFGGVVLGVFTLGMFFPWCNTKGAVFGQLVGTVVTVWMGVGSILYGKSPDSQRKLLVSTVCCNTTNQHCAVANFTMPDQRPMLAAVSNSSVLPAGDYNPFYALSFWYTAGVGVSITVCVGLLVSFLTGPNKPADSDPRLFFPIIDNPSLPEKVRRFFRFGVPDMLDPEMKCMVPKPAIIGQQNSEHCSTFLET